MRGRPPGLARHAGEFSQQVRFASARYSVPVRLIGTQVGVRTDDGRLLAVVTGTGEVVAEHVLVAPGEASVLDEHYGGPRSAPRRAVRPKTAAEKAFCALGPTAEAFITGAAAAGHTWLGPELAELNTLRAVHGEEVFGAALERAVAFGRWRAADVRSILAAGPGTADPRAAGDVLGLPVVPVRPLSHYALGRALGIASHWPFDSWGRFLPEHNTAVSLLHHASVVDTTGVSCTFTQLHECRSVS